MYTYNFTSLSAAVEEVSKGPSSMIGAFIGIGICDA